MYHYSLFGYSLGDDDEIPFVFLSTYSISFEIFSILYSVVCVLCIVCYGERGGESSTHVVENVQAAPILNQMETHQKLLQKNLQTIKQKNSKCLL